MKNFTKTVVISAVGLGGLFVFAVAIIGLVTYLGGKSPADVGSAMLARVSGEPTPTPAATTPPAASAAGDKSIPKSFTLGKDSVSEYGEVAFDHDSHAFKNYSPDGKSVMGCIECHHTDQPKSGLKPPLATSERDVVMTLETWKGSSQKVSECRTCHFQDGNVPDGKTMPSATYTGTKTVTVALTNQEAYHRNCNVCHDAAFKLRPELKSRPGFATTKDCTVCHKTN
ncbi:MAG: cytochrome c3 family protein [Acidobacteriota bacterium]